jgi:hypothetical protein
LVAVLVFSGVSSGTVAADELFDMRVEALQNDMTLIENDMTFVSIHSLQMLLEDPTEILRLTDMLELAPAPERVPQRRRKYHIHVLTDTAPQS